ncbi:MAG: hypothetical protein HND47_23265 [Chloroflexi bacterium]|nr:hypothetical protein [Chloroflexota bacterium]
MNARTRIKQLEKRRGKGDKMQYLCVSHPEDTEYTAKPFMGAGESLTFKTLDAMTAFFDERPEFELLHIAIEYASGGGE